MLPSLHSVTPTGLQDQLKAWGEPVFRMQPGAGLVVSQAGRIIGGNV